MPGSFRRGEPTCRGIDSKESGSRSRPGDPTTRLDPIQPPPGERGGSSEASLLRRAARPRVLLTAPPYAPPLHLMTCGRRPDPSQAFHDAEGWAVFGAGQSLACSAPAKVSLDAGGELHETSLDLVPRA